MNISAFDLFKIGIGPSSSHTVGPMIAACRFAARLRERPQFARIHAIRVELFGSLGATGKGHGTDKAVLLGLEGNLPDTIDPDYAEQRVAVIREAKVLELAGMRPVAFDEKTQLAFLRREMLPLHPNGMRFTALDANGAALEAQVYYSVGGGFVVNDAGSRLNGQPSTGDVPYPFRTGVDLLRLCGESGLSIADVMMANEATWRTREAVRAGLLTIRDAMAASIARGCSIEGTLPGPLKVRRRASAVHAQLKAQSEECLRDPLSMIDWINLYAMAVNEENAAGGRIVKIGRAHV